VDPDKQRLQCFGHIINLISMAILYRVDEDCVAEVLEALERDEEADGKALTSFNTIIATKDEASRLQA